MLNSTTFDVHCDGLWLMPGPAEDTDVDEVVDDEETPELNEEDEEGDEEEDDEEEEGDEDVDELPSR